MRLGILGGTFNPIHLGHVILAECARDQCALDQVWFIPTAIPPHKPSRQLLDGAQRLALVRLAIRGHPAFRASDVELRLGGVSYTLRTVRLLRARHPHANLFLIVGSDMLQVPWYGMAELRRLCTFVVAPRPTTRPLRPFDAPRHAAGLAQGRPERAKRVEGRRLPGMRTITIPQVEISSSMIRARIRRGRSIRYLVPDAVRQAILRRRLYAGGP
ncbi:MAG: nicotinate (nicotinamide) nucleotide adenylyltransferase [Candidatus Omnitrophica bacterium]|nr:nicotinate (nicotinamide) nucleotide adenylyltransferase [Candidatus Omnitrophota bacterium]